MALRNRLVHVLRKELCGPRDGPHERMKSKEGKLPPDPSDEYVIGVLEPKDFRRGSFVHFGGSILMGDQNISRMDDDEKFPDEEEDYDYGKGPAEITPKLDPRALPKSVGLSFVIKSKENPQIAFCATWARYKKETNDWKRIPYFLIKRGVAVNKDNLWTSDQDPGVVLHLRQIPVADGIHVSLYLVNATTLSRPRKLKVPVEELVFQPQIRVVCEEGTELATIRLEDEREQDVERLALLYRNRDVKARGRSL